MNIDKNYVLSLAEEILNIPSPSGYTKDVIARIKQEANAFDLHSIQTKKGNLIVDVPGTSDKTVGLIVHVDTLGGMVRSISDNGDIKFTSIGGPLWPTLDGEYCQIITREGKSYTGTFLSDSPAVHVHKDAKSKTRDPQNMYVRIDEQVSGKQDVLDLGVGVGDYIVFDPKTTITKSGFIKSRFLDDKINVASVFGLVKALKAENKSPVPNLKLIISTFEEVGHGSAYIPEVDELIAVDMGCIGEDLTCSEEDVSICAKDSSGPYDYDLVSLFKNLAVKHSINHAVDIYPMYGSDVSAARSGGNDFKGGLIGPGVHASHGMERTHYNAVKATIELLYKYVSES